MKLSIIILACLALVAAEPLLKRDGVKADKDFLVKQKFFLEILHDIHEPLQFPEYLKVSEKFVEDKSSYLDWEHVKDFFIYWDHQNFLPRGHIFSIYNEEHLEQVMYLFNFFYYAKDWTTFYKNVCWARVHMNEGMFVYALTMTVLHHKDYTGIVLPAPYEIVPYMFFDSRVINDAYEFKMNYLQDKTEGYDMWYVWANYTQDYYYSHEESSLSYFREDLGWNSYYYYYHMDYPFWMDGEEFGLSKDHRGELFLHMHQQILARYYMERLSQRLDEIPEFSYGKPIEYGYNPHMMYYNGQGFTVRKNYYEVYNTEEFHDIQLVLDYERRFRDIVDRGFYVTFEGKKIDLRTPEGVEYLGSLMEHNEDSVDKRFFGYWRLLSHSLLGGSYGIYFNNDKWVIPSVMEHFETAMRDPVFYMLYKRLINIYIKYQHFLPHYQYSELLFNGVEITDVQVDKIETFFDYFDADLTTLMGYNWMFNEPNVLFKARQWRLNYKPFNMNIEIKSDKAQKVIMKVFLGPKYDQYGKLYTLEENRENFYQIDQFVYDLPAGKSVIKHSSEDFYWNVKDRTTWTELYKRVMLAIDGKMDFTLDMTEAHCGFPERLLIPRGWVKGMPVQMFFMVLPYQDVKHYEGYNEKISCGVGSGYRYMDNYPFAYPFDREIVDFETFYVPNMHFEDVNIYHLEQYGEYYTTY
ncbi:larval serum protein 1 beta chain-like [Condylostylus longicornis]|uniref:larval serum protein 1 beta chain-like n=1 Tax=Condylostylus longicornis TaxID=2530218 RepID=UPI00244E2613|nr:larval serum protein 1 beta chain-like [Condylostylus longicornis]